MIYVNPNWTYRESVEHIQALKDDYIEILSSFSVFEHQKKRDFIGGIRKKIFALKLEYWQRENLWNYMNDYLPYSFLKKSSLRYK